MSIPPLVCSTPPPPEQCEDDKDHEDFDLQYNSSQEDYDGNYDYDTFSTYNHFQSSPSVNQVSEDVPIPTKIEENDEQCIITETCKDVNEIVVDSGAVRENLKLEEDPIEDLNLIVEEDTIEQTNLSDTITETETTIHTAVLDCSVKEIPLQDTIDDFERQKEDSAVASLDNIQEPPIFTDEIVEDESYVAQINISKSASRNISPFKNAIKDPVEHSDKLNDVADDDFGDFNDFQTVHDVSSIPISIVDQIDNPWARNEPEDSNFGEFTANFDDTENNFQTLQTITEHSKEECKSSNQSMKNVPDDDDFGEFDDFKSSVIEAESNVVAEESITLQEVPVLNLRTPDNEIVEQINKEISAIFDPEIETPETELGGKLDSVLGETWGHLLETDVRQPYIVNWNNSRGQNTLLKSLCIDSRNILFGPKWSYNMPKYATNLSMAPLQPLKPSVSSVAQSVTSNLEKTQGAKSSGTWSDPFTSDGQEFTYAEALLLDLEHLMATLDQMAHSHSTLKISELLSHACNPDTASDNAVIEAGPTDMDVFEAAVSSKPDKIYSNTLNVQPLRQINLPDTHIFTPTDSETPRSKTIHYDSNPSVLLPETLIERNKNLSGDLTSQPSTSSSSVANVPVDDNDDWEFQDFKGPTDTQRTVKQKTPESATSVPVPNTVITYATQVLQPIKVEPIMPTLNWPDPGEVTETFEDFSDFVSNLSWSNGKHETANKTPLQIEKPVSGSSDKANDRVMSINSESFDDGFDTFQSVLPPQRSLEIDFNHLNNDIVTNTSVNTLPQMSSQKPSDLGNQFPKIDTFKSDSISLEIKLKPTENFVQQPMPFISSPLEKTTNLTDFKRKPIQTSIIPINLTLLQPTHASSSTASLGQQKSAQILQPLSLESYSQINWPNPGIDLQDLSRFNPVETLQSLKSDLSVNNQSKAATPVHSQKSSTTNLPEDDIWGEFVSSKPKQQQALPKKPPATFADDDEWTDFVSSPSVKPQNGLNTISFNVYTNSNNQKSSHQTKFSMKNNQIPLDVPTLNYITPKSNNQKTNNDRHFQNL